MRRRRDPHTKDLFATPRSVAIAYDAAVTGRGGLAAQISRVVGQMLSDAREFEGLSRTAIAERLSKSLGREVSDSTLDKWASEAAEDRMIPLDAFAAMIEATHSYEALGWLPGLFGHAVVEAKYIELIELQQIRDHKALLEARENALIARSRARS